MGASLASLTNDNDLLNGGDTAKRLTFVPGTTDYIVYLARDIQSVQVNFVHDPKNTPTLYQDGRTAQSYSMPTDSFARPGYDYTITDASGRVVTTIEGDYDSTSNKNASSPVYNNGDGDTAPQVYNVTYTPQTQTAILKTDNSDPANVSGLTYQTATGPTASTIQFNKSDDDLVRAGYNYNVTVSYTNSNGDKVSASYPTLALALAANATYNNNTIASGQADSNPQVFTLSYTPSSQTAILQTDATDPAGAQTVDTRNGVTAQAISFLKTDSDLARSGYSYQVLAPNNKSYDTLADALAADGVYDATANGTSTTDSEPQTFIVSYTAKPLTVNINYVYGAPKNGPVPPGDFGKNQVVPTKVIGVTNGTSYTTDVNSTATTTPITVPTIPGYTPNVTTITPKFTVDGNGNPTEPQITVTYSASPDSATITYVDESGNSLTPYIGSNPTSQNGYTDGVIMTTGPSVSGYTLVGFKYNDGSTNDNLADLSKALYTTGTDKIEFVYTPKPQVVNINYLYSSDDNSPKDGEVTASNTPGWSPSPEQLSQTKVSNASGDVINVPTIPGYTASVSQVTPDFAIKADDTPNGQLVTPDINVTYTANNQNAEISYLIASRDSSGNPDLTHLVPATSSQTRGAATTAVGVSDQPIGVSAPIIPGYSIYSRTANGTPVSDISLVPFDAIANPDKLEVIYVPDEQQVKVHYVFQLPAGYNGDYDNTPITDADNGKEVTDLPVITLTSYSNAPSTLDTLPTVPNGWEINPARQTIDWSTGTDGNLTKADYYYYVAPKSNEIDIQYLTTANENLIDLIHANNKNPILTTEVSTGSNFTYSGAFDIPGYAFNNYTYNGNSSIVRPDTTTTTMPYMSGANDLNIYYKPSEQSVAINYVYDQNDASSKNGPVTFGTGAQVVTEANGVTNGTTYTTNLDKATQVDVITPIVVPTLQGYTPNVTSVNPSFAINTDGTLINSSITVTYTANQNNVATMKYVDEAGKDISQYAATPVSLNASGTTDQPISTSGAVEIPGYTFDHIEYTTAASVTT